ncbi:cytochrome P450 oxidoreductase [Neofusicoccum parvum]|uniref:Cytochrome P450 oxidoreductase n=1 Tax=Neofusicoccum parvum TaxID=310453 RepID=A0ACB5SMH1_9PEZI|nr:cytochrome P450 oxidoreductase [Neofusicoccum parvum]
MATAQILPPILALVKHHPVALVLLVICCYLLSNRYQRNLHRIPGPWIRSVSTIPRMWSVYRGRSHEDDLALHRKYGKIVRVAPNTLSISDPKEITKIYGVGTKFYKSRFYELSAVYDEEGLVPDTFVLANKELHSRMKRNAASAYSMNALVQMEPWLDGPTDRLLQILKEHAASQKSCDLGELLKRYAMDAVFSLTFGQDLDFLRKGDEIGMFKTLDIFTDYMAIFGQVPWTHRFLLGNPTIATWFLGPAAASQDALLALAARSIQSSRAATTTTTTTPSSPPTFLHRLLHTQRAHPASLTDREILTHAFGNIAAGSDTTATALRAVLLALLTHPAALARLRRDLAAAGLTADRPISYARAAAVPYLVACVREATRLHPSVGMLLARVSDAPATLCGHAVAAGTEVGVVSSRKRSMEA